MKILSFVIPSYNCERFLELCIPSMLDSGELEKLEIIVVNDGSADGTAAVAETYCARYPDTVRLINQENKGHGGALNTGCAAATSKYLKVIDADDTVDTQNLPKFLELLESCESDVVLTHHRTIDISTGERKLWRSYPEEFGRGYTFEEIVPNWKSFDRSLTFHGITYRTAFYHRYAKPLAEHVFYEDHEFATFPCCYAGQVTPFDLVIYLYRIGDVTQSVSVANQLKRLGHTEAVLDKMLALYKDLDGVSQGGRGYARWKIQGLLMSYLTTTLPPHPERKPGSALAKPRLEICLEAIPQLKDLIGKRYSLLCLMNRLHIRKDTMDAVMASNLYRRIRGNHTFE